MADLRNKLNQDQVEFLGIEATAIADGSVSNTEYQYLAGVILPLQGQIDGKQIALSGTGFVKISGTTISYDNSTYLTTSSASSTYQPLDGDLTTIAGLTATTDNFLVSVSSAWASRTPAQVRATLDLEAGTDFLAYPTGTPTGSKYLRDDNSWQVIAGGGDALTSSPLSQFAATTSLQLLGVISDETGSGALVFANTPTLVTPILGTPTSGNLANCTFPTLNQNTSGSAATLTNTRTIWGQNFNGSANVTGTLALGASDLTLTGSIGATGARATKVWTAALESTAMPTVGGTAILTSLTAPTFTTIELGAAATDTTLARSGAGDMSIEGNVVYRAGGTDVPVTDGGTGRSTGTTAYALIATGTTATGAQQTLANGATTEILVGGGASALPVWTTAQGSGAPVRATSPTIASPAFTGTVTLPTGLTGPLRADSGVVSVDGTTIRKVKSSNEIVNNSAVLQNDDDLFFSVGANEIWAVKLFIQCNSPSTPDIKFQWSLPAGATGLVASEPSYDVQNFTGTTSCALNVSTTANLIFQGFIETAGTSGTAQLQWAQNTQTAVDTTVFAFSYLIAERLA